MSRGVIHPHVQFRATMKALIAKVLGYLILIGSVLLKAPQIYNIVASQNGDSISEYLH